MNPMKQCLHRAIQGALILTFSLTALKVRAQVKVDATVTPLIGSFHYDISVNNNSAEDLVIVSLVDAPLADPLIGPSLVTPVGFLGSYDGGLGFVDFLADSDIFAAGTTVNGFSFDSVSEPGTYFTTFAALGVLGTSFTGSIHFIGNHVPESGSTLLMACLGFMGLSVTRAGLSIHQNNSRKVQT